MKGMSEMQIETNKIAYRMDEAVKASGLGRTFLYERIASGELKSIKVGGRRLILHTELLDFLKTRRAVK
jgi:excisionase family DNA binding protein